MKKLLSVLLLSIILIFSMVSCSQNNSSSQVAAEEANQKQVTLTVVHKNGQKKDFTIKSDEQYLGDAFKNENVYSGTMGQYGIFITTADGEDTDDSKQEWWCLTKAGGSVNTSIDTTPFDDNDTFELTFTTGY